MTHHLRKWTLLFPCSTVNPKGVKARNAGLPETSWDAQTAAVSHTAGSYFLKQHRLPVFAAGGWQICFSWHIKSSPHTQWKNKTKSLHQNAHWLSWVAELRAAHLARVRVDAVCLQHLSLLEEIELRRFRSLTSVKKEQSWSSFFPSQQQNHQNGSNGVTATCWLGGTNDERLTLDSLWRQETRIGRGHFSSVLCGSGTASFFNTGPNSSFFAVTWYWCCAKFLSVWEF